MNTKIDFINGNTKRCLAAMFLPMMVAMFLNMAYNLVDSLWIGNLLGETAYAALTNSTPIILILNSVAMGATNGVSILLSQAIGANEKEKTEKMIMTSLAVAIIFSLGVTILLEVLLKPILVLLHTPNEIMQSAYQYLAIYVLGYLAVYLYCYFTAVLRSFAWVLSNSLHELNGIWIAVFISHVIAAAAATVVANRELCKQEKRN